MNWLSIMLIIHVAVSTVCYIVIYGNFRRHVVPVMKEAGDKQSYWTPVHMAMMSLVPIVNIVGAVQAHRITKTYVARKEAMEEYLANLERLSAYLDEQQKLTNQHGMDNLSGESSIDGDSRSPALE